jgi:putative addiction module CopG family antidote
MSTHIVKLPPDVYDFVQTSVESGRYENASELVRAALRALHREEKLSEEVRFSVVAVDGDVFRKLWEKSVQPSSSSSSSLTQW